VLAKLSKKQIRMLVLENELDEVMSSTSNWDILLFEFVRKILNRKQKIEVRYWEVSRMKLSEIERLSIIVK
jgi:hypothetical protein